MIKKLAIILGLIFVAELGIIVVFLTSFETFLLTFHKNDLPVLPEDVKTINLPDSLTLASEDKTYPVSETELAAWMQNPAEQTALNEHSLVNYFLLHAAPDSTKYEQFDTLKRPVLAKEAVGAYLLELEEKINRPPQDAVFVTDNDRATKFTPDRDGYALNLYDTLHRLEQALLLGQTKVTLAAETTSPQIKLSSLNNLGIKELLVTGQSDFTGSTLSRMQNIRVGSSQYNGIIVKPNEEFSFNKYLGVVDAEHGYKPELVIKPEGATPEFGGGLCQVSTTAFRAAFFGGLPITARRNHSYAVHYYEWISDSMPRAVGLDATIYSGVQDMKFINDTPGAILIWTRMEGKRLYFDFYGTKDGRQVIVDGPHPYDRQESGAVKSKVTRTVIKSGANPMVVTFQSNYVPPKTLPAVVEYPKPPEPAPPPPEAQSQIQ